MKLIILLAALACIQNAPCYAADRLMVDMYKSCMNHLIKGDPLHAMIWPDSNNVNDVAICAASPAPAVSATVSEGASYADQANDCLHRLKLVMRADSAKAQPEPVAEKVCEWRETFTPDGYKTGCNRTTAIPRGPYCHFCGYRITKARDA